MKDDLFKKMIKDIFDEEKPPLNLERKILQRINQRVYIRNFSLAIAASIVFIIVVFILFLPKNVNITKEERKIERRIEIVKKEEMKKTLEKKNDEKKLFYKKANEFYLVFPKDEDVFEETGNIVFYVSGDIKEIRYEIDGELYTKSLEDNEETVLIPYELEEGTHHLKVIYPDEIEVLFYSIGEV